MHLIKCFPFDRVTQTDKFKLVLFQIMYDDLSKADCRDTYTLSVVSY